MVRGDGSKRPENNQRLTAPPTHRPLNPRWARGSARSRSLHPHCPRLQTLFESQFRVCLLGSGNVVGGHPLGERLAPTSV